ncbi:hypothetical protein [Dysgonomonas termitidis]|uniref:Uncharacterized protein n=1 Tax=Dysgonomonas termitidis TaxID=1516126 RepID=A0ABV9KYD7_9BACT
MVKIRQKVFINQSAGVNMINKENVKITSRVEPNEIPVNNKAIVGESKTGFIKELPVLRQRQEPSILPFKSEQLQIIVEEDDEYHEPDIVDFEVEKPSDFYKDDLDDFDEDYGNDFEDSTISTGVSFEELSRTIEVLKKDEQTDIEKENTVNVLNQIEGTELFNFITINNSVYNHAKILMNPINNNLTSSETFDIRKFIN